jgi:hypothetical protein
MKILVESGIDEAKANELAGLARRSLTAFRRKLAQRSEVQQPPWARPAQAPDLLPILLAGAWSDAHEGDRQAVAEVAQVWYDQVAQRAIRWEHEEDAPVRRVGDSWYLVSKEDAWVNLGPFLTRPIVERFKDVVLKVLGTPDPSFDLAEDRRWMASALGHVPTYSPLLCGSLAETLALMGARGESIMVGTGMSARDAASDIVRHLLEQANRDWRVWASLAKWGALPSLAEAAPGVFLDVLEEELAGSPPVLVALFSVGGDSLFSYSPHTGLLWALETLAWSPEYLPRAALILARLARIDPGGRTANRPQNSLRAVFLPWYPQTTAT